MQCHISHDERHVFLLVINEASDRLEAAIDRLLMVVQLTWLSVL